MVRGPGPIIQINYKHVCHSVSVTKNLLRASHVEDGETVIEWREIYCGPLSPRRGCIICTPARTLVFASASVDRGGISRHPDKGARKTFSERVLLDKVKLFCI